MAGTDGLHPALNRRQREFWFIAFAAEMAEVKPAEIGGHELFDGIRGSFV